MSILLITGPSRSGKSEWAEQLTAQIATKKNQQVVYIATAQRDANDAEWQSRIAQHQQRRPATWECQEVPLALPMAMNAFTEGHCVLIDSLGTWLANTLEQEQAQWDDTQAQLIASLENTAADVVIVAEETGWGVVPAYELGRRFRDRLGMLSRRVGAIADDVYLVTSGYAINLSTLGQPVSGLSTANG